MEGTDELLGVPAEVMQGDLAVWFEGGIMAEGSCILCLIDSPAAEGVCNLLYRDTFFAAPLSSMLLIPRESAHPDLGKMIGQRWENGQAAWEDVKRYCLTIKQG